MGIMVRHRFSSALRGEPHSPLGRMAGLLALLCAAILLTTAPAQAGGKRHAKVPTKAGGLFVAPAPLDHPPRVLANIDEAKLLPAPEQPLAEPPPVAAQPAREEPPEEPPRSNGVAALRIHSLFE